METSCEYFLSTLFELAALENEKTSSIYPRWLVYRVVVIVVNFDLAIAPFPTPQTDGSAHRRDEKKPVAR